MSSSVVVDMRCKLQCDKDNPDMQVNVEVDARCKLQCDTDTPDICRQTWK